MSYIMTVITVYVARCLKQLVIDLYDQYNSTEVNNESNKRHINLFTQFGENHTYSRRYNPGKETHYSELLLSLTTFFLNRTDHFSSKPHGLVCGFHFRKPNQTKPQ
ncbi:hypothetical protein QL285_074821 [Trifolium repens]|nr:hypothetical protein QL285_074821 [Trifolium repens]